MKLEITPAEDSQARCGLCKQRRCDLKIGGLGGTIIDIPHITTGMAKRLRLSYQLTPSLADDLFDGNLCRADLGVGIVTCKSRHPWLVRRMSETLPN